MRAEQRWRSASEGFWRRCGGRRHGLKARAAKTNPAEAGWEALREVAGAGLD